MNPPSARTRPALKQDHIEQDLRDRIRDRTYPPGARIPTREELALHYRVTKTTVQRALDRLAQHGFLVANGRNGTQVAEHPPHLSRYAIVFPVVRRTDWNRFWTVLVSELMNPIWHKGRTVEAFYGIDGHTDTEDYRRLTAYIEGQALAGIIFLSPPGLLAGSPILEAPDLARVQLSTPAFRPTLSTVHLDGQAMIARAVKHLLDRGRRRLALLTTANDLETRRHFREALATHGLAARDPWIQSTAMDALSSANNCVQLLLDYPDGQRPDGLIISDDHLVEQATAGILSTGLRAGEHLDVVAHWNFPWPTSSTVPITRIGYHAIEVLDACMACLEATRDGQPPQQRVVVPRFENEL